MGNSANEDINDRLLFFDNPGAPGLSKYEKTIIDFIVMNILE
jgi:hypothetical protein